ncbi:MAG: ABC transporter substrate-binding protein [Candidatus Binatia bacterium]|jgi:ABC-type nitrate/sulfonate/bicarbonate transport system substrate-binding protein
MKPQRLWFTTWTTSLTQLCATVLFALVATQAARAQSFTNFRIANGTSGENPAVLWVGVDQGFYRKHGLNVEVIFMRSGPLAISALASSDVQMVFTSSNNVLNVAAGGLDVGVIGTVSGGRKETSWRGRKSKNRRT